jgi:hypothetical protein
MTDLEYFEEHGVYPWGDTIPWPPEADDEEWQCESE